jgi:hypothetical protein
MKIIKRHKNRTKHSEHFGIWSGVTLADIQMNWHGYQVSFGGLQDNIDHIKVGDNSHDAFIWFDDIQEARVLGQRLIDIADENDRRNKK